MARKLPETPEIQRLIRLSQASRACLDSEVSALRRKLDVPSRVRDSLAHHPSAWIAGSLASGLAASFMFRRRPAPVKKRRRFSGALLGLTLTAARPLAKVWLSGQLKQWVANFSDQHGSPSSPKTSSSPSHVQTSGSRPR